MHDYDRILITGASGFLGWHLCREAAEQGWDVVAVHRGRTVRGPATTAVQADLAQPRAIDDLLDRTRPTAVIHAAAQSQPNLCQQDPIGSRAINVVAVAALADQCRRRRLPLAFISTDMVFEGQSDAPYREDDQAKPVNIYGRQKLEAEEAVLAHDQSLVCRLPLMFGDVPDGLDHFLQELLRALRDGQTRRLFSDEYRTPVDARHAARGVLRAVRGFRGRIHLGGPQRVSRFELGRLAATTQGLDPELIEPCLQADVPMPAPRPADVSLDSSLARRQIGYDPPSLEEQLRRLRVGN